MLITEVSRDFCQLIFNENNAGDPLKETSITERCVSRFWVGQPVGNKNVRRPNDGLRCQDWMIRLQ